jgi:hypothetical protein
VRKLFLLIMLLASGSAGSLAYLGMTGDLPTWLPDGLREASTGWAMPAAGGIGLGIVGRLLFLDMPARALGWCVANRKQFVYLGFILFGGGVLVLA